MCTKTSPVPGWSGSSWASAPGGWRTSLATDSDSGGPVIWSEHRGPQWWHRGRSISTPPGHRGPFGAAERELESQFSEVSKRNSSLHWHWLRGAPAEMKRAVLRVNLCYLSSLGTMETDLVPGVSSVRWVDEDGDDLGFGQESRCPPCGHLWIKVVGTLLKVVVRTGVGRQREVLHIPVRQQTNPFFDPVQFAQHRQRDFIWVLCGWWVMCNSLLKTSNKSEDVNIGPTLSHECSAMFWECCLFSFPQKKNHLLFFITKVWKLNTKGSMLIQIIFTFGF